MNWQSAIRSEFDRLRKSVDESVALVEDGSAPVGQSLRSPAARSRALIITGQVAIATVLLVGAALLSRTFLELLNTDRGYVPSHLMTARVLIPSRNLAGGVRTNFYAAVVDRLKAIPGVTHAGFTSALPLTPPESRMGMASLSTPRLYAVLLGGFAVFALLISGTGLYGGLSYGVCQRTREIGVRTALGATPRDIVALVLKQGVVMTLCGLAAGYGLAVALVRSLSGFLFGVATYDVVSFTIVGVVLTLVALVACAIPARRAAKIDPLEALRS